MNNHEILDLPLLITVFTILPMTALYPPTLLLQCEGTEVEAEWSNSLDNGLNAPKTYYVIGQCTDPGGLPYPQVRA